MGEIRMCIDYQELNKNTKKNRYPLHFMDEMFDLLSGSTAYSLLDLCSDYNQLRIREGDEFKTVFERAVLACKRIRMCCARERGQ